MLANLAGILRYVFFKKRYSMVPFVGGLLGALGLFLVSQYRPFCWVPIVIDPGCGWLALKLLLNKRK
jgi:hypothetical protein